MVSVGGRCVILLSWLFVFNGLVIEKLMLCLKGVVVSSLILMLLVIKYVMFRFSWVLLLILRVMLRLVLFVMMLEVDLLGVMVVRLLWII